MIVLFFGNNCNSTLSFLTIRVLFIFITILIAGRARYVIRRLCWRKGNILSGLMTMTNGYLIV